MVSVVFRKVESVIVSRYLLASSHNFRSFFNPVLRGELQHIKMIVHENSRNFLVHLHEAISNTINSVPNKWLDFMGLTVLSTSVNVRY